MKIMDKVHEGKRPKFNVYNFGEKTFIRGEECNTPSKKKKKKKSGQFLFRPTYPTYLLSDRITPIEHDPSNEQTSKLCTVITAMSKPANHAL